MAKKTKEKKILQGVSVKEMEDYVKNNMVDVFVVVAVVVASVSSIFHFFTGPSWSIMLAGLGTILGILMPNSISENIEKFFSFVKTQDRTTQIIIGVVRIVIAIFQPLILFAIIGLQAGIGYHELEGKRKSS